MRYYRNSRGVTGISVGAPAIVATAPVWLPFAFIRTCFRLIGWFLRQARIGFDATVDVIRAVNRWTYGRRQARSVNPITGQPEAGWRQVQPDTPRSERMFHSDRR
jgi:hypothetical protein